MEVEMETNEGILFTCYFHDERDLTMSRMEEDKVVSIDFRFSELRN